jgi:hypothetical protein
MTATSIESIATIRRATDPPQEPRPLRSSPTLPHAAAEAVTLYRELSNKKTPPDRPFKTGPGFTPVRTVYLTENWRTRKGVMLDKHTSDQTFLY